LLDEGATNFSLIYSDLAAFLVVVLARALAGAFALAGALAGAFAFAGALTSEAFLRDVKRLNAFFLDIYISS
jgi:hypothetical protein